MAGVHGENPASLECALQLAPYDGSVRMMVASRQIQDDRFAEAIRTISPLAHHPHTREDSPAIDLLARAREGYEAQSKRETAARQP